MNSARLFSRMIKLSGLSLALFALASCSSSPTREIAGDGGEYSPVEKTHNKRFIKGDNF